jgi:hypothetical protein
MVSRAVCAFSGAVCILGVAARELHYARTDWPLPLAAAIDTALHWTLHSVVLNVVTAIPLLALGLVLIVLLVIRPRLVGTGEGPERALRPGLRAAAWVVLAANGFLLDLNPWLMRAALVVAVIGVVSTRWSRGARALCVVGAALVSIGFLPTHSDAFPLLGFALAILILLEPAARVLAAADRLLVGVLALIACELAASLLPLAFPSHGGRLLDSGMAYGLCEDVERVRIAAVFPGSGGGTDRYTEGRITLFDARTLTVRSRHHVFDEGFQGRLVAPLCLPDQLQVGMAQTFVEGEHRRENVLALQADDLSVLSKRVLQGQAGQTLFWDRVKDAVYYASEWSNAIVRLDRRTGEVRRVGRDFLPEDEHHRLLPGLSFPGSLALTNRPDQRRRSFYAGHWLTGSTVYEIGLDDDALVSILQPRCGAVSGITVDEELGRLFVSSMWGLDVFDVNTGRPVQRIRTGFGARTAVVDPSAGLVYVATTIEGRIHVLDRTTLARRGVIAIGYGPRNSLVTQTSPSLLATSSQALFAWSSEELRRRFQPAALAGPPSGGPSD